MCKAWRTSGMGQNVALTGLNEGPLVAPLQKFGILPGTCHERTFAHQLFRADGAPWEKTWRQHGVAATQAVSVPIANPDARGSLLVQTSSVRQFGHRQSIRRQSERIRSGPFRQALELGCVR